MKKKSKKMVAAIVITILVISYFLFYMWIGFSISSGIPFIMKVGLLVIPIGLIVLMVSLLFERINEIKEEDKDDLSKY
ncbi:hypothetical protein LZ578_02260 [Jeotgalibaca sp. MA1X17-3]|uniref:hypothetical protein n=1 Tax=Jeotgalibaca sp. MA1X17-3 TaxID=2908211 RepID=UPI001F20677B|nr:hypothetical protein [Jeotgalibaca sp. MA1X17-3]UJF15990.1 hypothetical protein LZ578_02260 [Jeotgalibaca sp. MA1X17-3]